MGRKSRGSRRGTRPRRAPPRGPLRPPHLQGKRRDLRAPRAGDGEPVRLLPSRPEFRLALKSCSDSTFPGRRTSSGSSAAARASAPRGCAIVRRPVQGVVEAGSGPEPFQADRVNFLQGFPLRLPPSPLLLHIHKKAGPLAVSFESSGLRKPRRRRGDGSIWKQTLRGGQGGEEVVT